MDLITAVAVLVNQARDMESIVGLVTTQAYQVQTLINQENSVPAINPQVAGIIASVNGNMESLRAQATLLQQAVDRVAQLTV